MNDHNHDCIVNDHSPSYHFGHHEAAGIDVAAALGIPHADGHSVIGHFLGTDSCSEHVQNYDFGGHTPSMHAGDTNPAQVTGLETLKLNWNHVLAGIKFSRNVLFIGIIGLMTMWLCAISWVRHNEPSLNSALGMGAGSAPAEPASQLQNLAPVDQALLDGTRHAMPIPAPMTQARQATLPQYYITQPGAPNSVTTQVFSAKPQAQSAPLSPYSGSQQSQLYRVQVKDGSSIRLKTIVTR